MTVCIATLCHNGEYMVMASDFMIPSTAGLTADNTAMKTRVIGKAWWSLFSGDDLSHVTPILDRVYDALGNPDGHDLSEVVDAFVKAFKDETRAICEREVLNNWGITLDRFVNEGAKLFATDFAVINARIAEVRINCTFLVCGFNRTTSRAGRNPGHIFTISGEYYGRSAGGAFLQYCENPAFAAIGTGSLNALSMLFFFEQSFVTPLPKTVYVVAAAKFMAESAGGVGQQTKLHVFSKDGFVFELSKMDKELRGFWQQGRPRVVDGSIARIKTGVRRFGPPQKVR